jgi:outer membrane protein OmpA-like peptidoglycan-associated protein
MKNILIIPIVAAAFLAACASAPQRNDQLEQARAQVQTLSQDPLATQAASRELEAARSELGQAEAAFEKREPVDRVNHLAYLATRHAEIGQARIAEARAREQIAQGEAERNRVLLEARTREAERATQQAQSAQATAQMQTQAAEAARQEALLARTQAETSRTDAETARTEAEMARTDAATARANAETMAQQLAALQAEETKRGMVMTLSDVLFDTGAATLKPGADLALNRLADFLKQNEETRIIIEGHTDSRGADSYNEDLSQRRGRAVSDGLMARGVTSERIEVIGRGEAYPVANNETAEGRQQNRRVEIIFSDEAGRFAQSAREGSMR